MPDGPRQHAPDRCRGADGAADHPLTVVTDAPFTSLPAVDEA